MKKTLILCQALAYALVFLAGCGGSPTDVADTSRRGLGEYDFSLASLSGTDTQGRKVAPMYARKSDKRRYVGMFYWLWEGNNDHQFGVYDNTRLMSTEEGRAALYNVTSPPGDDLPNASPLNYMHWTNQPLFGYYNMSDPWIVARHIEMLTMADIDYIFLDTTNSYTYSKNENQNIEASQLVGAGYNLLDTMLEYSGQGWDVPKVAFYTNTNSGEMVGRIYDEYYKSGKYEDLWFKPDGKPLIVGTTEKNAGGSNMDVNNPAAYSNISKSLQEYFDVKESQWPYMAPTDVGFPWMSWEYPQALHKDSRAISVSVSQHSKLNTAFSLMHPYSSKGYDYHTDTVEENWRAGKNFENQWETVFSYEADGQDVEFVNVTGWNEWIGQKLYLPEYIPIQNGSPTGMVFIDNFTAEYSRDVEPDKEYYKDAVYMQLVRNVRKFKYYGMQEGAQVRWGKTPAGGMSDLESAPAVYRDFTKDARNRDYYGYDIRKTSKAAGREGAWYSDFSARNDIASVRVAQDGNKLFFLVETVDDITPYEGGDNWMNILIKTNASAAAGSFEGYDYIVNRAPDGGKTSVQKSVGGWNWQDTGRAELTVKGNKMMIEIPLSALGLDGENVRFEFKVADNVRKPSWFGETDAEHDMLHYYVTGDSAPIGRLNYAYGY